MCSAPINVGTLCLCGLVGGFSLLLIVSWFLVVFLHLILCVCCVSLVATPASPLYRLGWLLGVGDVTMHTQTSSDNVLDTMWYGNPIYSYLTCLAITTAVQLNLALLNHHYSCSSTSPYVTITTAVHQPHPM